ncbi:unnamed protein product [Blepharisma stoltei]|uniref:Uncharacterized protein n=1 Tax=Blepharisma stoltei TaxID=1481888 RepID=A0AAU9JGG4_9CILI|nr:unnamed protein product [Blepharisma stoltei]
MEEVRNLTKKLLRYEEMLKRSEEINQKLEKDLESARRIIKNEKDNNTILKNENSKTVANFKSLKDSYIKLSEDIQALNIKFRNKKNQRDQENLEWDHKVLNLKREIEKKDKLLEIKENEIHRLSQIIDEKEQNVEEMRRQFVIIQQDLNNQLQYSKNSELQLKEKLDKLQSDFYQKQQSLINFQHKSRASEETLELFHSILRYKEDEIHANKVKARELEAKEDYLQEAINTLQGQLRLIRQKKEEKLLKKRRESMESRCSIRTV